MFYRKECQPKKRCIILLRQGVINTSLLEKTKKIVVKHMQDELYGGFLKSSYVSAYCYAK